MKIVSAAEMREIDRVTSDNFGVPSLALMEAAGSAVAKFTLSDYPQARKVSVVCGKGNNGGDGFVVARKLAEAGLVVRVLLLGAPDDLRGDAATMFRKLGILPLIVRDVDAFATADAELIFSADLIVDAILGTGFRPPVSPLYAAAISRINESRGVVIAVDIPSGANADAMHPAGGVAARADAIVTFTAPRPAHVFAEMTAGPTLIAPIGSPPEAITSQLNLHLCTAADFGALLAPRRRDANKGSFGHVLVIGGSLGKAGAAAMAGYAALRAGAGLCTVATARSVVATVSGFHPEVMTEPLEETRDGTISRSAQDASSIAALAGPKSVLAIGPGISRHPETVEFVKGLVKKYNVPMVLDADALNAFEGCTRELTGVGRTLVITPHPGEMARLTGMKVAEIQENRLDIARAFARDHRLIVVLKGYRTLIASPDGEVWVNPTGNPGMATGGTGDVLTGIVASLLAQHPQHALEATVLAVYLHGLAGDLAVKSLGEHSLVATDLIRYLPEAFAMSGKTSTADLRIHA